MGIDLQARFFPVDVTVRGPQDEMVPGGVLSFKSAGLSASHSMPFKQGRATLFATRLPVAVTASAAGYRSATLHGVSQPSVLRLEKGMPVQLSLPASFRLPEPPLFLEVECVPAGSATRSLSPASGRFMGHELALHLGAPASYTLSWRLVEAREFNPRGVTLEDAGELLLVFAQDGGRERRLAIDADRLQRAIAAACGR